MTILGIDLGTTNTLVAAMHNGTPVTLPNEMGEHLLPSAVAIAADGATLVGRAAWDRLVAVPEAGRAFFKRDMGTPTTYSFGGRHWTPVECSALVLAEAKRVAALHLPGPRDGNASAGTQEETPRAPATPLRLRSTQPCERLRFVAVRVRACRSRRSRCRARTSCPA